MIYGITVPVMHEISWQKLRNRNGNEARESDKEKHRYYLHFFLNRNNVTRDDQRIIDSLWELKEQIEHGEVLSEAGQKKAEKYLSVDRLGRGNKLHMRFNEEAIKQAKKNYGYFTLVSNKTMDYFEALTDYRLREKIEEAFKVQKDCLDCKRYRVWTSVRLRGRMFVQFVAWVITVSCKAELRR